MRTDGRFDLRHKLLFLLIGAVLPGAAGHALAQTQDATQNPPAPKRADIAPVHAGTTELGGFVGGSYGLDNWRVMGGGNVAYAVTRYIMPYAEYSYFPGISRQLTTPEGKANFEVPLSDFHGGVHIRIPLGQSKIVPYAVVGAGMIHSGNTPVKISFPDGFTLSSTIDSSNNFAANFGGGIRFYTSERVGFRFESKVYVPTGTYTTPFMKVEAGVFFQLR